MPKLPQTIYVQWRVLNSDDPYLTAYDTLLECVDDDDGPALVGEYRLVQEKKDKRIVTEV